MKILAFTAGAAQMYCGSCLRDNTLAAELKRLSHDVILQPLYTPTRTDEQNVSERRVFMNGITVCLEQQSVFFRKTRWLLDRIWDSPWMIRLASKSSIAVNPHVLGEMTVSVLRGERGYQLKDIRKLTTWLAAEAPPDIITLPNSMLSGLAKPIREATGRPVCCTLQGEDLFLNQLPEPYRSQSWDLVRSNAEHVDAYAAVSEFAAAYWQHHLRIPSHKIHVVPLGINVPLILPSRDREGAVAVGYLARIAPEKGLHLLAEACLSLNLPLRAAGYLAPEHRDYLRDIEQKAGPQFHYEGELTHAQKTEFFHGISVFSVPFTYDEPKGLSVLEAMAHGIPVVEPSRGAMPEILNRTGGGILVEPDSPQALAEGILAASKNSADLGRRGAQGVREHYSATRMAGRALEVYGSIVHSAVHA